MARVSMIFGAALAVAAATPATAASTFFFGNDLNGTGGQIAVTPSSAPHATTQETAWDNSVAGLTLSQGQLSALAPGAIPANGVTIAFGDGYSVTLKAPGTGSAISDSPTGNGHFATTGAADNYALAFTNGLEFDFNAPIYGFGFYLTDLGDANVTGAMTAYSNNVAVASYSFMCPGSSGCITYSSGGTENASISFLGVTNLTVPFDKIVFSSNGNDAIGIDDFMIATPEPASYALLGCGLLGLAAIRRRARRPA